MKEFKIQIEDDGTIYINDREHTCSAVLDRAEPEVDQDKKVILALIDEMGYEPQYLCEELADRLAELCEEAFDEIEEDIEDIDDYEDEEEDY